VRDVAPESPITYTKLVLSAQAIAIEGRALPPTPPSWWPASIDPRTDRGRRELAAFIEMGRIYDRFNEYRPYEARRDYAAAFARASAEDRPRVRAAFLARHLPVEAPELLELVRARLEIVSRNGELSSHTWGEWARMAAAVRDPEVQELLFRLADVAATLGRLKRRGFAGDLPISRDHLRELAQSTITKEHALEAGIWSEFDDDVITAIRGCRRPGEYIVFPYVRPGRDTPDHFRVKRTDGRKRGYAQPVGVPTGIYFPPRARAQGVLSDATVPLVICEGEKKALALDRLGLAVLAVPGVWCAHDSGRPSGEHVLHPWITEHVVIDGRDVIVAFDSNLRSNRGVQAAAARLRGMLMAAGAAQVRQVVWPVDLPVGINGVDDLAQQCGDAAVRALLAGAVVPKIASTIRVPWAQLPQTMSIPEKLTLGAVMGATSSGTSSAGLEQLASALRRSPQVTAHHLRNLEARALVTVVRDQPRYDDDRGWTQTGNEYRPAAHLGTADPILDIAPEDLEIGDLPALVLALAREAAPGTPVPLVRLAAELGVSTRAVRAAVAKIPADRLPRGRGHVVAPAGGTGSG